MPQPKCRSSWAGHLSINPQVFLELVLLSNIFVYLAKEFVHYSCVTLVVKNFSRHGIPTS